MAVRNGVGPEAGRGVTGTASGQPHYWAEAVRHLQRRDRILRRLVPQHAGASLGVPVPAFTSLARIIISQQLSTRSAEQAWQRFEQACGHPNPGPEAVQALDARTGLDCLPRRKADYIRALAGRFTGEWAQQPPDWQALDDEAAIVQLGKIRGVGRWTAEMFLIFHLQRPDVLPLDDAGLLKAISLHYFSGEPVSRFEAREVAQAWSPWRTVAAWHLWRSLDPASVRY